MSKKNQKPSKNARNADTNGEEDKPLNDKAIIFCHKMAEGMAQTVAYQEAFKIKNYESAAASACRLLKNAKVKSYLEELRNEVREKAVLSIQEKREYLAEILRTPIRKIQQDSPLIQEVRITTTTDKEGNKTQTTTIKIPSKLDAIKIDNIMMGHNNPVELDVTHDVAKIYEEILEREEEMPIVKNVTPQKQNNELPGPLDGAA